jgi:hypothetical protein
MAVPEAMICCEWGSMKQLHWQDTGRWLKNKKALHKLLHE